MEFGLYSLLGVLLACLLAVRCRPDTLTLTLCYWSILFLWSIGLLEIFSFTTHSWSSTMDIQLAFHLDGLSKLFSAVISGIGVLIFAYAYAYTQTHPEQRRKLFSLLQLFAISMLGIVLADDFILLFLCWELTTVTSYHLIQFDIQRQDANQAASNSMFITVMGSLAMLVGILILTQSSQSYSIQSNIEFFMLQPSPTTQHTVAYGLILLGALTKSAQFPFSFWLTGAMKAPTPVSAYLHSATMVNAGIYLLARLHPALSELSFWYPVLGTFGLTTMATASCLSVLQDDLKLLLAYTTLFSLGAMTYLLGSTAPVTIEAFLLFFLFHSIYKAAAFMLVGAIDQNYGTRSLAKLVGIARNNWVLFLLSLIIFGSMAGFPPFFGFAVKEMIIEAKLASPSVSYVIVGISLASSMLIATASIKCLWGLVKKNTHVLTDNKKLKFGMLCPAILSVIILLFSLFEKRIQNLIQAAMSAILPQTDSFFVSTISSTSFILGLLTAVGGIFIYMLGKDIIHAKFHCPTYLNPRIGFERLLQTMIQFGSVLTDMTQNQPLTKQLVLISLTIATLISCTLTSLYITSDMILPQTQLALSDLPPALFLILSAVALILGRHFLSNLISLSLIGIATSFIFMKHGAIDLAMTQILVEILAIIIILMSLQNTPFSDLQQTPKTKRFHILIASLIGVSITLMLIILKHLPLNTELSTYYISNSLPKAFGKNVVNVILVDFRALDTLGEVLVVVATVLAGVMLARNLYAYNRN